MLLWALGHLWFPWFSHVLGSMRRELAQCSNASRKLEIHLHKQRTSQWNLRPILKLVTLGFTEYTASKAGCQVDFSQSRWILQNINMQPGSAPTWLFIHPLRKSIQFDDFPNYKPPLPSIEFQDLPTMFDDTGGYTGYTIKIPLYPLYLNKTSLHSIKPIKIQSFLLVHVVAAFASGRQQAVLQVEPPR